MTPLTTAKRLDRIEKALAQRRSQQTQTQGRLDQAFNEFCLAHYIKSGGTLKPFELWPWQSDVIGWIGESPPPSDSPKLSVIIKGRQLGLSQLCCSWFLYKAWQNPAWTGVIISRTQSDSSLLASRMREMASTAGLVDFSTDSLLKLEISGGGTLHFRSAAVDAVRGIDSVSGLLFDEAAFQTNLKLSLSAATPAMSQVGSSARIILCSTPNGASGHFFDTLNGFDGCVSDIERVRAGELPPVHKWQRENGNVAIAIHWKAVYGDNPHYLEDLEKSLSLPKAQIAQEYDLSLTESSSAVFSFAVVRAAATGEYEAKFAEDELYYIGVDPAGSGADYFCSVFLKKVGKTFTVSKLYRKRTGTLEVHMGRIDEFIKASNPVKATVETNGLGQFVYESLESRYGSVIERFNTSANSKGALIGRLQLALERGHITYPAGSPIEQELLSFRRVEDKLEAAEGSHDDTVMALALALKAVNYGARR